MRCLACRKLTSLPKAPEPYTSFACGHPDCGQFMRITDVSYPKGRPYLDSETGTALILVEPITKEEYDEILNLKLLRENKQKHKRRIP